MEHIVCGEKTIKIFYKINEKWLSWLYLKNSESGEKVSTSWMNLLHWQVALREAALCPVVEILFSKAIMTNLSWFISFYNTWSHLS
jgi:hypothetical protein